MNRVFDRIPEFDDRSRGYPIRALVSSDPLVTRRWRCRIYLDQGAEGACVGFGWAHELAAAPVKVLVDNSFARQVYYEARRVDEWPGEDYEGTSVLAGAKVVRSLGFMSEFRWAFGLDDVLRTISQFGPVVLGLNWYEGMLETDADGFITPSGGLVGGHCILARGVEVDREFVVLHNSWGKSWGRKARARLRWDDLDRLLREDGEACVPVVRHS